MRYSGHISRANGCAAGASIENARRARIFSGAIGPVAALGQPEACGAGAIDEVRHERPVFAARLGLDAGGDVYSVGRGRGDGLGDVVGRQAAGEDDRAELRRLAREGPVERLPRAAALSGDGGIQEKRVSAPGIAGRGRTSSSYATRMALMQRKPSTASTTEGDSSP